MPKRKKENDEIIDILNIKDEYKTEDLINYINELDAELQRLIRNLIKLKSRANPDRAAFKESPNGPNMDKHLLFILKRHGFNVEEEFAIVNGLPYKVYEKSFGYLMRHKIFEKKRVVIVVKGETDKNKILKAAHPDSIVFIRRNDNKFERLI